MKKILLAITVISIAVTSCCNKTANNVDYSDPSLWVQTGVEINPAYADVVWFTGTMFHEQQDEDGNQLHRIFLTDEQKEKLYKVGFGTYKLLFPDSLNFFSPCLHQFTLDLIDQPQHVEDSLFEAVGDEAYAFFHYYMENMNNGRPYILAGMSQGGMMVRSVLKRMSDEEFAGMKAAYCMGFGLSPEDVECKHIVPATGEFDLGVTISYNSVADEAGIWELVRNNAVSCINPVNWQTDSTPASFEYNGMLLSAHIDPAYNLIFVDGFDFSTIGAVDGFEKYPWFPTNLHVADIPVYAPYIRRNALDRAYGLGAE